MAQFHETRMGMRFYEADVPRMVKALEGLQQAVEQLAKAAQPVAPAPRERQFCDACDSDIAGAPAGYNADKYPLCRDCVESSGDEQATREVTAAEENEAEARSIARQLYKNDELVEIDDDAEVDPVFSGPEDDLQVTGAWVAARVYVEFTANKGGK